MSARKRTKHSPGLWALRCWLRSAGEEGSERVANGAVDRAVRGHAKVGRPYFDPRCFGGAARLPSHYAVGARVDRHEADAIRIRRDGVLAGFGAARSRQASGAEHSRDPESPEHPNQSNVGSGYRMDRHRIHER